MARKKAETIIGLGNEDKLTVQKSLPLFALWRSELTLSEFKILDLYLSRIDSHKPDRRQITLEKGEIESALGVAKINNQVLEMRLKHLMGNVVKLPDQSFKKGFCLVTLFEEAVAEPTDSGLWSVKLECTQKAMKYFFNVENLGYLRYKLRCVTSLTSRYTYVMFIYLESNRFRKTWEVELDELKAILNCDTEETYKEFKFFNDKILKRVQREMHEKTECRYIYEPVRKGRAVSAIRFTVQTLPELEAPAADPNQYRFDENGNLTLPGQESPHDFIHGAVPEFSDEEFDQLFAVLASVPDSKLPYYNIPVADRYGEPDLEFRRYHYLSERLAAMNRADSKKHINNRFAYFLKLLKADAELN